MKLSDLLNIKNITVAMKARNKNLAIEELADLIVESHHSIKKDDLIRILLERERLGSTGIGDGVAIPHGKVPGIIEPIISFGKSEAGLDFDSIDGQPVYLFFLLVAPENSANIHLKALARIARILKNQSLRKQLLEAKTREDIYKVIINDDEEL
ncbi:MAG: PTS sugar transporter subunit IIA [Desulfatiglans sp.]|jgi:PTS system nitrogen regulatory IIA component|nr:PTS sugar transporter subunit IIA [Desulfatiglans sp.]